MTGYRASALEVTEFIAANIGKRASAEWRDGVSHRAWQKLTSEERRAIVERVARRRLAKDRATAPAPTPIAAGVRSRGYVVACADGCGGFVPARVPRPVVAYVPGHARRRKRKRKPRQVAA